MWRDAAGRVPVDSRATRRAGASSVSSSATPAIAASSVRAAAAPHSTASVATEVSDGYTYRAMSLSSNPAIDRSRGTDSPARCATAMPASAIRSFEYVIAVGRVAASADQRASRLAALPRAEVRLDDAALDPARRAGAPRTPSRRRRAWSMSEEPATCASDRWPRPTRWSTVAIMPSTSSTETAGNGRVDVGVAERDGRESERLDQREPLVGRAEVGEEDAVDASLRRELAVGVRLERTGRHGGEHERLTRRATARARRPR